MPSSMKRLRFAWRLSLKDSRPAEPVTVSGNLIEFPRQLVAAKKARPRIAEGPLREDGAGQPQLRIFEVEPEQVTSAVPEPASRAGVAEHPARKHGGGGARRCAKRAGRNMHCSRSPRRLQLRLMAFAVDSCVVLTAFVGFITVAV